MFDLFKIRVRSMPDQILAPANYSPFSSFSPLRKPGLGSRDTLGSPGISFLHEGLSSQPAAPSRCRTRACSAGLLLGLNVPALRHRGHQLHQPRAVDQCNRACPGEPHGVQGEAAAGAMLSMNDVKGLTRDWPSMITGITQDSAA